MLTWLLIALLAGLAVAGYMFAVSIGDLLARRDVPIDGEAPTALERVIEHARSGARRVRAAWWHYLRGRRSP